MTIANDTLWATKGDLAVATGNDAAAVLAVSSVAGQTLVKDSAASTGLAWATSWWASRMPTGAISETTPRTGMEENKTTGLTTQRLRLSALYIPADTTITSITFISGGTAAGTPTNWWFALYDSSLNLLRQTGDQTTSAWAADTVKTVNLTSTYVVTTEGLYYIGVMMKATTPVNIRSRGGANILWTSLAPVLTGQTSDTGLTDTAPNPAGSLSGDNLLYGYIS